MIYTGKVNYKGNLGYIRNIIINGLEVRDSHSSFDIFSSKIETEDSLRINVDKMFSNRAGAKASYILKDLNTGDNTVICQDGKILKNTETSSYGKWLIGGSFCILIAVMMNSCKTKIRI